MEHPDDKVPPVEEPKTDAENPETGSGDESTDAVTTDDTARLGERGEVGDVGDEGDR